MPPTYHEGSGVVRADKAGEAFTGQGLDRAGFTLDTRGGYDFGLDTTTTTPCTTFVRSGHWIQGSGKGVPFLNVRVLSPGDIAFIVLSSGH